MIELSYILLLFVSYSIEIIYVLQKGYDPLIVLGLYIIATVTVLVGYKYYKRSLYKTTYIGKRIKISVNIKRMHIFMFILSLISLCYTITTGVGTAESYVTARYSQIFSILNINSIFMIYYVMGREKATKLYWINAGIYLAYRLVQGWTGILLTYFLYEAYYWAKRKNKENYKVSPKQMFLSVIVVLIIIGLGGFVYKYVYVLKYMIRYGDDFFGTNFLSWQQGIKALVSRFSYLDSLVRSMYNRDNIVATYLRQDNPFIEIKSMLRPLLPRVMMGDKTFSSMGSSIYQGATGLTNYNVTDSIGIVGFAYLMFKANYVMGLIWMIFYVLSFKFTKALTECLAEYKGQYRFFYFILLIGFLQTGNIETLFTQTYLKMIFFIPVLMVLGIFKVRILKNGRKRDYEDIAYNISST